jgi:hypothetical protein
MPNNAEEYRRYVEFLIYFVSEWDKKQEPQKKLKSSEWSNCTIEQDNHEKVYLQDMQKNAVLLFPVKTIICDQGEYKTYEDVDQPRRLYYGIKTDDRGRPVKSDLLLVPCDKQGAVDTTAHPEVINSVEVCSELVGSYKDKLYTVNLDTDLCAYILKHKIHPFTKREDSVAQLVVDKINTYLMKYGVAYPGDLVFIEDRRGRGGSSITSQIYNENSGKDKEKFKKYDAYIDGISQVTMGEKPKEFLNLVKQIVKTTDQDKRTKLESKLDNMLLYNKMAQLVGDTRNIFIHATTGGSGYGSGALHISS